MKTQKPRKISKHEKTLLEAANEVKHLSSYEITSRHNMLADQITKIEVESRRLQATLAENRLKISDLKAKHEGLATVLSSR